MVDADYVVDPDWLRVTVAHFEPPRVAVVQCPQAHRDWQHNAFQRMASWEYDGFFRIGMHHRNERDAIIQHGTMTLVRKRALVDTGGWSEWCICEDAELGLRLMNAGWETRYIDEVLGRGLTPSNFIGLQVAALPLGVRRDADPEAPLELAVGPPGRRAARHADDARRPGLTAASASTS